MNLTRNVVEIAAPAAVIYAYAAATERWPEWLPHYRSVRVLAADGATRTVAMAAWRDVFPISWVAEQTNDPLTPRITFRHVRGATRGMDVAWEFEPLGDGRTRVTIEHRLAFRFPFAADWLGRHVVSDYFVHGVASRTLACFKALAETSPR